MAEPDVILLRRLFLIVTLLAVVLGMIPTEQVQAAPSCGSAVIDTQICALPIGAQPRLAQGCAQVQGILPEVALPRHAPPAENLAEGPAAPCRLSGTPPRTPWKPPRLPS